MLFLLLFITLDFAILFYFYKDAFVKTVNDVVSIFSKRVTKASLIPNTKDKLLSLLETLKGDKSDENIAHQLSLKTLIPRDIDWIKTNGQCMDKLVQKVSTVSHAGRGAFSQTFIPKGEIVVMAPLLHIMDYDTTYMYPIELNEEGKMVRTSIDGDDDVDDENDIIGQQLITNYCFGHDEGSMLLCPQTNAILINHCSTRHDYDGDCGRYNKNNDPAMRGANAAIRWAEEWDPDTTSWLQLSLDEIRKRVKEGKRGLSFEVIATRDIFPGDEVRMVVQVFTYFTYFNLTVLFGEAVMDIVS